MNEGGLVSSLPRVTPANTSKGTSARIHLLWAVAAVALFVAGLLIGRGTRSPKTPDSDLSNTVPAPGNLVKCIKVLDGDTIRVKWRGNIEDVRILGIDCPETKHGKKLTQQAQSLRLKKEYVLNYGKIARSTTENWLLNRDVNLVFPGDKVQRDSFGRLLAYVEEHGVDIGERLLSGGNAFLWDSEHPRRDTYELLESEAKKKRKGVWRKT